MVTTPDEHSTGVAEARFVVPVLERHADDVASNWTLRNTAVNSPHFTIGDLTKLDSRIEANLDALRIGGAAGMSVVLRSIEDHEPGELFCAGVILFENMGTGSLPDVLADALGKVELADAVVSSLGWLPRDRAGAHISRYLSDPSPGVRGLAVAAAAVRRSDLGPFLEQSISAEDPRLKSRALRAIAELGRLDILAVSRWYLNADDPDLRFSAAWSTAVLSPNPEALSALATIAQSDSRHRGRALQTAMRRADPGAAKVWLRRLVQDGATLRLAVQGAGAIGDPAEIPWLIEHMKVPELARVAGESFTTITGMDLAYEDLETDRPEGFESGPTENPADENVEMDSDENLPWPDPKLIQRWWQSNRHSYQPGTRYLLGKPITIEWCKQVLRIGRQRQRAAAALELAMRQPGTPLFEVRAPGFLQKQLLGL